MPATIHSTVSTIHLLLALITQHIPWHGHALTNVFIINRSDVRTVGAFKY
ncbi:MULTISPECIES: hypothetical protein [unclassified Lactococcus]|nr:MULTISPECIES: hypothetical protein [unclassified Lactococcus]MQW21985.1 hypothetical protein [Lactococcus sp. dk101]